MLKRRFTNRITTKIRIRIPTGRWIDTKPMVVGERRDHGNTNAEHGQHHRGHQPVKKPHGNRELLRVRRHPDAHFRTSEGVIALGSFFSPARLVNDCE